MKDALDIRTNVCDVRTCHVFRTNHIFIIRSNVSDVRIYDICVIRTNDICVIRTNDICVIRTNDICVIRTNNISIIRTYKVFVDRILINNVQRIVGQYYRLAFWKVKIKRNLKTNFFSLTIFWRIRFLVMLETMQCQIVKDIIFNVTVEAA